MNQMFSSFSSHCFRVRSFLDPGREAIKVQNIQESKRAHIFKVSIECFSGGFLSSYLGAQVGGSKIACCLPVVWKGHPKDLRQLLGDQNKPGVLTIFGGKPDHPRKVKSSCRPKVGVMESGPGNVTELIHREARLLW